MQALDQRTIHEAKIAGTRLMERAGKGVVEVLEQQFGSPSGKQITIFCGKGNNGGDGLVVARLLHRKRARVRVLLFANAQDLTKDAETMYRRLMKVARPSVITRNPSETVMQAWVSKSDVLIDALLGTGISSVVRESYRTGIEAMNAGQAPTLAVDLPSGIHSDTGAILGSAVRARATATFGCPKVGLYLGAAIDHAGAITTVDIGIPRDYVEQVQSPVCLLTPHTVAPVLPRREQASHKGTAGHVGIIAGSPGKTGAAALAARATLRAGAGLVTVATPSSAHATLEAKLLEAMTVPMAETDEHTLSRSALNPLIDFAKGRQAIALGPGLSTHPETGELVRHLLPHLKQGYVIDADGLNLLAGHLSVLSSSHVTPILTPHPGEMARLLGETSTPSVNADRLGIALRFAKAYRVILVLKGARTIVAAPDGSAAICTTGNPGMATAGMGDVLTGVIVSFLAQGLTPWDAARVGVCLHGLAGDIAAETLGHTGMIASDLIEQLPCAFRTTLSLH